MLSRSDNPYFPDITIATQISSTHLGPILTTEDNFVKGVVFEDGDEMECSCICFAVSTPEF